MLLRPLRTALALSLVASGALAQEAPGVLAARGELSRAAFTEWRAEHGPGWRMNADARAGRADFVGGGTADGSFTPRDERGWFAAARGFVEETAPITGLEAATLVEQRVKLLPLGLVGTSDKWSVRFAQELDGVPVLGGTVNVLMDAAGNLLSVQSSGIPDLVGLDTRARIDAQRAAALASAAFTERTRLVGELTREPVLGVAPHEEGRVLEPRLVWEVELLWQADGFEPEGTRYWIDARDGSVLRERDIIHHLNVGGVVQSMASPGTKPDTTNNPEVATPMPYVRVTSNAGTLETDVNGAFNYPGITGPLDVTVKYFGTWADIDDNLGADYVLFTTLTGTGNTVVMNPATPETVTSQANTYLHISYLRDWIRSIDPTDDTADFQALGRTNLNSTCNAYFDGSSVNFFASGGGCVNTAFSTVVAHEIGHWLNVLYGTQNGSDGMGEGNADVFALYLYDTPVLGEGFFGPGTYVRHAINNIMFCGDCCPGCHGGGVHTEGQAWMGAAWHVRERLDGTHGNATGDAIANALFLAWMNGYVQTQIKSVIELQWLTLDDDDGNIENGTPNYADIDAGFRDQGFPGIDLPRMLFSDVTELPDTTDEAGPYTVSGFVVSQTTLPVLSVELVHRVGDGPWIPLLMVPTANPNEYYEDIQGQLSPTTVDYYIRATDTGGHVETWPREGEEGPLSFRVGVVNVLFADDFEGDDNGWTHGSFGDTPNLHDDFHHGEPAGVAGDPISAVSGTKVWGNDLGSGAFNGLYQNDQHNWLRSPVIDCSEAQNTVLSYWRWLKSELSLNDRAAVRVNGVEIWVNDDTEDALASEWVLETFDVSELCDGNPAVQIEFSLETNGTVVHGGWNLDDVRLDSLAPVPGGGATGTPYCFGDGSASPCPCGNTGGTGEGCANSTGSGAVLSAAGSTSVGADDITFAGASLLPNQPALLFAGLNAVNGGDGVTFGDGLRCAGGAVERLGVTSPDSQGDASWGPGLAATGGWGAGDIRRFQTWYRNPGGSPCASGFNLSNGVEVVFTP